MKLKGLPVYTEKWLTDEILVDSELFPKPESIYAQGIWRCSPLLIANVEDTLGYLIPSELRDFYLSFGAGRLPGYVHTAYNSPNNILLPPHIPRLISGLCKWMMGYTQMEPKTLPFFEVDVDLFLCLKPDSENPNAVWWMWGELQPNQGKICDSLVEFFEKLVVDPNWFNPPRNLA